MTQRSLEEHADMLERRVEILEQLPDRVTAVEQQIVQLRDEMRAEFSATRAEARVNDETLGHTLRDEIQAGDERVIHTLREEIHAGDERVIRTLREEIRESNEQVMRTLRQEIRDGDEETRRFMRVLHEEVIERIRLLGGAS